MRFGAAFLLTLLTAVGSFAQEFSPPDRSEPGDEMIQAYLSRVTTKLHLSFADDLKSRADWQSRVPKYREEYLYMLGLHPLPERTPLNATVTGTLQGEGFVVDNLHYQSKPGLYVTANLYRPAASNEGERRPAVLYVCGHSGRGRDGNKTAFQSHGMWFARHGYVCLVVDTLQLGEIAAIHHGTYRENRWWWHSRGYTPAGVECWNGVRGIDYLVSRADVDPERIAVTGISGGGAATFWVAAADERVRVAVPVSGMADLPSYVPNRVINGHCDCMFLYNTFEWPWTRIAGLVAPRPMLFVNSDRDAIFPMDANERIIAQLERLYALHGAGHDVDTVVSIGGHDYRQDLRQAVYRFINQHLKGDARPVTDGEVDLVKDSQPQFHPIDPKRLRVFPTDGDIPQDQLNTTIDEHFVPAADVAPPAEGKFDEWKKSLTGELRRVALRALPERIPWAIIFRPPDETKLMTEEGIAVGLRTVGRSPEGESQRVLLLVPNAAAADPLAIPKWLEQIRKETDRVYLCEYRGIGETRWTNKNPPNYVARSHVLLGRTVDTGRVYDVAATARRMRKLHQGAEVHLLGEGAGAVLAAYAALIEPDVACVIAVQPLGTHMAPSAPQFLNVLRVADIPEIFGLLAPRPLTIVSQDERFQRTAAIYAAAESSGKLTLSKLEK